MRRARSRSAIGCWASASSRCRVADAKPRKRRSRAAEMVGVAIVIAGIAVAIWLSPRAPDHAVVLVTVEDCRRAFSEAACRAIVDRAQAIHAETAPSFEERPTCELIYGAGHCSVLRRELIQLNRFAPTMVAILTTRDRGGIVPLYEAPEAKPGEASAGAGRALYFRGAPVGRLMQAQIGGAD